MTAALLLDENVEVQVEGAELELRELAEVAQALTAVVAPHNAMECRLTLSLRERVGTHLHAWVAQVAVSLPGRLVALQSPVQGSFPAALESVLGTLRSRLEESAQHHQLRALGALG